MIRIPDSEVVGVVNVIMMSIGARTRPRGDDSYRELRKEIEAVLELYGDENTV